MLSYACKQLAWHAIKTMCMAVKKEKLAALGTPHSPQGRQGRANGKRHLPSRIYLERSERKKEEEEEERAWRKGRQANRHLPALYLYLYLYLSLFLLPTEGRRRKEEEEEGEGGREKELSCSQTFWSEQF